MSYLVTVGPSDGSAFSTGTTSSVTLTGCTAGNAIIIGVRWLGAPTISSISVNGESNATVHGSPSSSKHQFASLANITASGDKTITVTMSAGVDYGRMFAFEASGQNISSLFDVEADAGGTGTAPSVSITTSVDGCLLVALITHDGADPSAGSGFTVITLANTFNYDQGEYKLDAGAAGAKTVDFSTGVSGGWGIKAAAFKPAGGAGATVGISGSSATQSAGTSAPGISIAL